MMYSVDGADVSMPYHTRQFVFAALGAFLYTTHLPERLSPGTFDIIGHSHQVSEHNVSKWGSHLHLWLFVLKYSENYFVRPF